MSLDKFDPSKVLKIIIYDTVNLFYDGFGAADSISILYLHTYGRFLFIRFLVWTYDIQIGNFVMQFIIRSFLYQQLGLVILFQEMIRRYI